MTMISDQAHVILASLRENVEGTEHRGPCDDWGIVYLDNARIKGVSAHAFAGFLSALTAAGYYEPVDGDPCFGYVKL